MNENTPNEAELRDAYQHHVMVSGPEMRKTLGAEFDRGIARIKATAKAEQYTKMAAVFYEAERIAQEQAWAEGFDAGEADAMNNLHTEDHECTPNPYTTSEEQP